MGTDTRRILIVITRADTIGGAHTHVVTLADALQQRGHDVLVAVGQPSGGPFRVMLDRFGVRHVEVPSLMRSVRPRAERKAFGEIKQIIEEFRPDVVHCHSSKAGVIGRLAARSTGTPAVFTAHGWSFAEGVPRAPAAVWARIERAVARRCPGPIIVVSDEDRQIAVGREVVADDRMIVVHNGVPDISSEFRSDPTSRPATIIMVARLDAQKDHDTLLDALHLLKRSDLRVLLVGDGPRTEAVQERLRLEETDGVELLGLRQDVDRLLSEAQLFVLTTNWEGLPLSIVEAMRAGLPTIASDVGGVAELVDDGQTGYLVPRGDSEAVARRIADVLDDPSASSRMGGQARARFEATLTVDKMVDATTAVYERAIGE